MLDWKGSPIITTERISEAAMKAALEIVAGYAASEYVVRDIIIRHMADAGVADAA
jgi:hypothetical protein